MKDRIEIRMFGRLFVRRSNGEVVDPDEWTTGKTTDLLRLLALNANRPVSVHSIIDKLWPDVDEDKAKASLRTAASGIRQTLQEACVERHLGGLVLRNAWADVTAFQTIVHDVNAALHLGAHARVVARAREAEALYIADFRAYDDKSFWAAESRDSLRLSRQSLLADAAESAFKLLWMRDAIDFATLAIAGDPCFERPHRTLMQAHAALGEIELALRAFEHLRVCLSQELGADPSPQTRALHIQMLSGDTDELTIRPFVGRKEAVQALATDLREAIAGDGCDVVCLTGPAGSGRGALLQAAAARVQHSHLRQLLGDGDHSSNAQRLARVASDRRSGVTVWGPCDGDPGEEADRVLGFLAELDPTTPRVIAVVTSNEAGDLLANSLEGSPITLHRQSTGAMSHTDLASLASATLSGRPTPRLLRELAEQSGQLAGRAVTILREWISSGWIISTVSGLDLYHDAVAVTGVYPAGDHFRTTLEQLTFAETDFCQLLAMIDEPVSPEFLRDLTATGKHGPAHLEELCAQLDELADLGVLRVTPDGYEFRNRTIRDAFEHRLRPAVKARLLRQIGQKVHHDLSAEA